MNRNGFTKYEDYKLDKPAKWCPGCGNHAILSVIQKVLPETGINKELVKVRNMELHSIKNLINLLLSI